MTNSLTRSVESKQSYLLTTAYIFIVTSSQKLAESMATHSCITDYYGQVQNERCIIVHKSEFIYLSCPCGSTRLQLHQDHIHYPVKRCLLDLAPVEKPTSCCSQSHCLSTAFFCLLNIYTWSLSNHLAGLKRVKLIHSFSIWHKKWMFDLCGDLWALFYVTTVLADTSFRPAVTQPLTVGCWACMHWVIVCWLLA